MVKCAQGPLRRQAARFHAVRWGRATLLLTPLALGLAIVLAPEGRLTCPTPEAREASPNGAWTLTLCRRPMWFAMPGGGSDAPGWVVLRDRAGAIHGVTGLSMVQLYGGETVWRPFRFPGSAQQWQGLTDMTDARLLARHLAWAATTPAARDEAFNVVDGDVFRWSWMWGCIAGWFGLEPAPFDGTVQPLERQMADDAPVWAEIAARHGLVEPDLNRLASAWHTDADLGRPIEVVTDMSKSRRLGFLDYQATDAAFLDLFGTLRASRVIP